MQKKTDLRIVKTKKAIRNTVAKLLAEKDIDEITITEIAENACINRKTFYNYYSSVHDVINEIGNEFVEILDQVMNEEIFPMLSHGEFLKNPDQFFIPVIKAMENDMDFYKHLLKIKSNSDLTTKLSQILKTKLEAAVREIIHPGMDDAQLHIIVDFLAAGMIFSFRDWYNSDMKLSVEEFSKTIGEIVAHGIASFMA